MRVLMTADPGSSTWQFAVDLAAGLGESGVETVLATLGARLLPAQRRDVRKHPSIVLAESTYRLEWMPDPWHDLAAAGEWLLTVAQRHQVDIVHCNHLGHGQLPWNAPVLVVGHACVASWWEAVHHEPVPRAWDRYLAHVGASLRAANAVIAPSHAMLSSLQRHYGPLVDSAVIHSARCPMPHFSTRKEPHIFASGRIWDDAKNFRTLGRIAPEVQWPIHIAGSTLTPSGEQTDIPNVDLLGPLSNRALSVWLRRAAVFALPAWYEPSALSVLDAARAGCALVLGDIPSLRELWDGAAHFVAPDDEIGLLRALETLASRRDLRAALARSARQRAVTFSHERCVREYLLAYRVLRGGYERLYDGVREAPQRLAKLSTWE